MFKKRETHLAKLSDLPLTVRLFLKAYRFRKIDPVPWTPLRKPLSECKLALVTTAAFYLPSQPPFDEGYRGGDPSFREIPYPSESFSSLPVGHRSESFNHEGIERDFNLALPLLLAQELQASGFIGSINHRHFSFMGSVTAPMRLIKETAPQVAQLLKEDQVDIVFLTPV